MRRMMIGVCFAVIGLAGAAEAVADQMYGGVGRGSQNNPGGLLRVDQTTAAATLVGDPITPGGLTGIDFNSAGTLFGSSIHGNPFQGNFQGSRLVTIDRHTGGLSNDFGIITAAGAMISIGDIAIQPGTDKIYGIRSNADGATLGGELYVIDAATAEASLIGATGSPNGGGLAFADDGTLYLTGTDAAFLQNKLFTIDPASAVQLSAVDLSLNINIFDGLGVRADGAIFATEGRTGLLYTIGIDGQVTLIGDPAIGKLSDVAFISEPRSAALMLGGFVGMAAIRRRRRAGSAGRCEPAGTESK